MLSRRRLAAPLVLVPLLALAGCGGGDDTSAAPASRSASVPPAPTSEPSPGSSSGSSPSRTVAPATGAPMRNGFITARAPEGWVSGRSSFTNSAIFLNDGGSRPAGGIVTMVGTTQEGGQRSIQQQAKAGLSAYRDAVDTLVGYPRFAGRDWFELTGRSRYHERVDLYGRDERSTSSYSVYLRFTFPEAFPAARRRQIEESVLATVRFAK